MRSNVSPHLNQLYQTIGLQPPREDEDIAAAIKVDDRYSIRLLECPTDHVVLFCEVDRVDPAISSLLLEFNLFDQTPYPYLYAVTQPNQMLVMWQRLPLQAIENCGLYPAFEAFTKAVEQVAHLMRDAAHAAPTTSAQTPSATAIAA